jgi:hypothetical protein
VRRKAFKDTLLTLQARLRLFTSLAVDKLDRLVLKQEIKRIGQAVGESV